MREKLATRAHFALFPAHGQGRSRPAKRRCTSVNTVGLRPRVALAERGVARARARRFRASFPPAHAKTLLTALFPSSRRPRGPKKHLKRLNAPSHWMLDKLGGVFAPKPSPGPHKQRECLPLCLILRNRLKYALTYKEVTTILQQRLVKVDGKVRRDKCYPTGIMDVVSIDKTDEHFRIIYDQKGRFVVHSITSLEAQVRTRHTERTRVFRATHGKTRGWMMCRDCQSPPPRVSRAECDWRIDRRGRRRDCNKQMRAHRARLLKVRADERAFAAKRRAAVRRASTNGPPAGS